MTQRADSCAVRFRRDDGAVVGAGFLLPDGRVMTCAHVLNSALDRELLTPDRPEPASSVRLDFPLAGGEAAVRSIAAWGLADGLDAAVVELDAPPPKARRGLELAAPAEPRGVGFRAFGFPRGFAQEGRNEAGVVQGRVASGRLEIRPRDGHDYFVEQGFSGAAAFTDDGDVLGMVVATGPEPEKRLAYLVPARELEKVWPPLARPYRGLAVFDEETAHWFRGRTAFVRLIRDKLDTQTVVAVVGASGSGKSSVVRAGVVPELRAEGWAIAKCRIDAEPCFAVAEALVDLLFPGESHGARLTRSEELAVTIRTQPESALKRIRALVEDHPRTGLFVLLDQFEELITRAPEPERSAFDAWLVQLMAADRLEGLRLALTLRSDFEDAIARLDSGRELLNAGRVRLTKMTRDELAAAVRGPAAELGVTFENGRDWHLVERVERNDALLPLMQYALQELWARQSDRVIAEAAFQAIGGLEGVLATKADEVLEGLSADDRASARRLFIELVNVTEAGLEHDTKLARRRDALGDDLWRVAQAFAAEGVWLLTTRAAADAPAGAATVEITHEALIRNWRTLAEWLEEVRELRVWQAAVRKAMAAFPAGRPPPFTETLNEGDRARAARLLARDDVDPAVRAFAEQMLGNTRAAELWADLQSPSRRVETLPLAPAADAATRNALLDRLLALDRCAEAFLEAPWSTTRALVGLDPARRSALGPWIERGPEGAAERFTTRCRAMLGLALAWPAPPTPFADLLLDALRQTGRPDQFGQCRALGEALAALAPRLDDPEAVAALADGLLDALRQTTDPYQCRAVGEALAGLAPRLDDHTAVAERWLDALRQADGSDQCEALGQALAALAPRLDDPTAVAALADGLLDALRQTTDPWQSVAVGQALAALAPRLGDPEAVAERWLDALRQTTAPWQSDALGQALAALAPRLDDPEAVAERWLDALRQTTAPWQSGALGAALAALAPRLDDPEAVAEPWFDALRQTTDTYQCRAVGEALAGLAPRLDDPTAVAERWLDALRETTDPSQSGALGRALVALAPRLDDPEALAALADGLLDALRQSTDPSQWEALGQALAGLAPRLDDPTAVAERWLDALRETTDLSQSGALGRALAALAPRLDDPEAVAALADGLLDALRQTTDPDQCRALGEALAALAPRLDDPEAVAERWFDDLRQTTNLWQSGALGEALAALATGRALNAADPPLWFARVFGVLRHPWLVFESPERNAPLERPLLEALAVPADGTLWDAVARLQELYPEADLAAPWPLPLVARAAADGGAAPDGGP